MHCFKFFTAVTLLTAFILAGCSKVEVTTPDFKVSTAAATYKVGEEIIFEFEGNPENITFYSGESDYRYDSVGLYRHAIGVPELQFTSATAQATEETRQLFIKLLVASDFGEPTTSNIQTASWTEITNRAIWAPTSDNTGSGVIDLQELAVSLEQPVRFAFKYERPSNLASNISNPVWAIRRFDIDMRLYDGSVNALSSLTTAGWTVIDMTGVAPTWVPDNTQVRIASSSGANFPEQEDWAITAPINLLETTPVYTKGVAIKSISSGLNSYTHRYDQPGQYRASFVASNVNARTEKKAIQHVDITIEP